MDNNEILLLYSLDDGLLVCLHTWCPMQYSQTRAHNTMIGLHVQHLSTSSDYDIIQLSTAEAY